MWFVARTHNRFGLRFLVATAVVLFARHPVFALHQESPAAVRLTTGGDHVVPPTRSWNFQVVFSSDQDLLGNGTVGRQIYMFSQFDYDCQLGNVRPDVVEASLHCPEPPAPYLRQLTNDVGNPDSPAISFDGRYVTFDADGSFGGGTGPQAAHRQIFVIDLQTHALRRATAAADGDSVHPSMNRSGGVIAFESTAALLTPTASPGTRNVFVYLDGSIGHAPANTILQLTNGRGPSGYATPDRDGAHITFESTADLLGDGHDTGISQVFLSDVNKGVVPIQVHLYQMTRGNGPSRHPYPAEKQGWFAFESAATNLRGATSADPVFEVYWAQFTGLDFPDVRQITTLDPFGSCTYPTVDPADSRIAMVCTGDPLFNGSTGNRAFVYDVSASQLFQITSRGDVTPPVSASAGNNFVFLADTTDLTGGDACGHQLYMVDYFPGSGHFQPAMERGQLPNDVVLGRPTNDIIGTRTFELLPGDRPGGSHATVVDASGSHDIPLEGIGAVELDIGAPDLALHQASVSVPAGAILVPPISVPGFGTLCITPTAPPTSTTLHAGPPVIGTGVLDCAGGRAGGDVSTVVDHNLNAAGITNPQCVGGCVEGAAPAPECDGRFAGIHDGACNGPTVVTPSGALAAGGLMVELPISIALSVSPDSTGAFCTAGNTYVWQDVATTLRLTTGASTTDVLDADDVAGVERRLADTGAPFSCDALYHADLGGAELVGTVPLLDVPNIGPVSDVVLGLHFAATPPTVPCRDCQCDAPAVCQTDADCHGTDLCSGEERCENHTCVAPTPLACDDGNPCTDDTCDPVAGCRHTDNTAACDDGNACTTHDVCAAGACAGTTAADGTACDDHEPCTAQDACHAGTCQGTAIANGLTCSDGNPCTHGDTCAGGVCAGVAVADGTSCSDGDVCDGAEVCEGGTCQIGAALDCDDGNPCTDHHCDPHAGCRHAPLWGVACDDGNACTTVDYCVAGTCDGVLLNRCLAPDTCHDDGVCDPATGVCSANAVKPDNAPCSDDDACTRTDRCQSGVCVGSDPVDCTAPDTCHDAGVCIPATGACSAPAVADDTACDDGSPCTTGDVCHAGVCSGAAKDCSDGNPCNGAEVCDAATGTCAAGPPADCDDGDPCTDDSCDAAKGCTHQAVADLGSCRLRQIDGRLTAIAQQVQQGGATALGGPHRWHRLQTAIGLARTQVEHAFGGPAARRQRAMLRAKARLERFAETLVRGEELDKVDAAVGQGFSDAVAQVASDLDGVRALVAAGG